MLILILAALAYQAGGASLAKPASQALDPVSSPTPVTASLPQTSSTCSILLVDNDEDFTSELGGGLPYYTSALDALGYDYQVWDLGSQGSPLSADLAPYQAVLWFTGSKRIEPFSFEHEILVADYLDQGGSLFLSALDYYLTESLSWFMQDYLSIDHFECDEVELDPVGVTGNPIGDGLGPYTLTRPDEEVAYWPKDEDQGPFTDYVYANTSVPGVASPFKFQAADETNSTNYDARFFKSVFLAWPVEWIANLNDRVAILGASLVWLCDLEHADLQVTQSASPTPLYPGSQLTYTLTVTNLGPKPAEAARLTDLLPDQVRFVTASSGCVLMDDKVSCNLGDVAPGSIVQVNITVAAPAYPVMLTNQVQISSLTFDPGLENNLSILNTPVLEPLFRRLFLAQVNKNDD